MSDKDDFLCPMSEGCDKDLRETIAEMVYNADRSVKFLEPGFLDKAIVGIDESSCRVIYDSDKLIDAYKERFAKEGEDDESAMNCAIDQVWNDTFPECERLAQEGAPIILRAIP